MSTNGRFAAFPENAADGKPHRYEVGLTVSESEDATISVFLMVTAGKDRHSFKCATLDVALGG